jgi:hypothetical protein
MGKKEGSILVIYALSSGNKRAIDKLLFIETE